MRSLIITRKAQIDIWTTVAWLNQRYRPATAAKWYAAIMEAVDGALHLPGQRPELDDLSVGIDLREKIVRRYRGVVYRILYSFDNTTVTIHRIRNSSQDRLTEDDF